jgi:hypothetical protein
VPDSGQRYVVEQRPQRFGYQVCHDALVLLEV